LHLFTLLADHVQGPLGPPLFLRHGLLGLFTKAIVDSTMFQANNRRGMLGVLLEIYSNPVVDVGCPEFNVHARQGVKNPPHCFSVSRLQGMAFCNPLANPSLLREFRTKFSDINRDYAPEDYKGFSTNDFCQLADDLERAQVGLGRK
jgi:hypothetical protein